MKKRLLAVLVAAVTAVSLLACGGGSSSSGSSGSADAGAGDAAAASDMKVAMVTDYGDITDQSFNQTTYEACKAFAEANSVDFTYYKPEGDSTADRVAMIDKAVADGYTVLVLPGYAFAEAIVESAETYTDVKFVALDVSEYDLCTAAGTDTYAQENVFSAVYQEELSGYMAGYAAVKMGYKQLGFLGGMAVPAVIKGGTEVVFACGGGIYTSAAEAAAKEGKKVIGVDVDQSALIDGQYGEGMTITSAMKGLGATVNTLLTAIMNGEWDNYKGQIQTLGMVSGDDPTLNYVQLPMDTTVWNDGFTQDNYKELVKKLADGTITVSNDVSAEQPSADTVKINFQGNIK